MSNLERNKREVSLKIETGLEGLVPLLCLVWWFSGIAMAQGIGWKAAACVPPVGMLIAVERVISVYAPQLLKD